MLLSFQGIAVEVTFALTNFAMKLQAWYRVLQLLIVLIALALGNLDAEKMTVLTNVNVTDGTTAPSQRNKTVVIEGDLIRSIGGDKTDIPSRAKTVDMHGQTIMPLIINTHGHLEW